MDGILDRLRKEIEKKGYEGYKVLPNYSISDLTDNIVLYSPANEILAVFRTMKEHGAIAITDTDDKESRDKKNERLMGYNGVQVKLKKGIDRKIPVYWIEKNKDASLKFYTLSKNEEEWFAMEETVLPLKDDLVNLINGMNKNNLETYVMRENSRLECSAVLLAFLLIYILLASFCRLIELTTNHLILIGIIVGVVVLPSIQSVAFGKLMLKMRGENQKE